jgi:hypothetical protein
MLVSTCLVPAADQLLQAVLASSSYWFFFQGVSLFSPPPMEFLGLSFSLGLKVQADIDTKLGLSVTRPGFNLSVFSLVATFGHSKFYLSPNNVGVLLQAAIGGSAAQFKVS